MTTKQIEKIKSVNQKSVLDLGMAIVDTYQIIKHLREVSVREDDYNQLGALEYIIKSAMLESNVLLNKYYNIDEQGTREPSEFDD